MSVLTINVPNHPDRLACSHCYCEIMVQREGQAMIPLSPTTAWGIGWVRELEIGEPPVGFDPTCQCECHTAYWRVQRMAY